MNPKSFARGPMADMRSGAAARVLSDLARSRGSTSVSRRMVVDPRSLWVTGGVGTGSDFDRRAELLQRGSYKPMTGSEASRSKQETETEKKKGKRGKRGHERAE